MLSLTVVPQGSVLSPMLWNIMYDDVLRLKLLKGIHIIEFADDIAPVIRGKYLDELVRTCYTVVDTVRSWKAGMCRKLADHKIDVLLISRRKMMEFITITVLDLGITGNQVHGSAD